MDRFTCRAVGVPAQQGSKTAFVVKGRAVMKESNSDALKAWRDLVTTTARLTLASAGHRGTEPLFGKHEPVTLAVAFIMPRPATVKREWPSVAPDLDKLTRAIGDALTKARVYADDAQVVSIDVIESYPEGDAAPHAEIVVRRVNNNALAQWRARNGR